MIGSHPYGLAWDMSTQLTWAKHACVPPGGWDHISDRHDHDVILPGFRTLHMVILQGRYPWRIRTLPGLAIITFETRTDASIVFHQPYFGWNTSIPSWTERHSNSEST